MCLAICLIGEKKVFYSCLWEFSPILNLLYYSKKTWKAFEGDGKDVSLTPLLYLVWLYQSWSCRIGLHIWKENSRIQSDNWSHLLSWLVIIQIIHNNLSLGPVGALIERGNRIRSEQRKEQWLSFILLSRQPPQLFSKKLSEGGCSIALGHFLPLPALLLPPPPLWRNEGKENKLTMSCLQNPKRTGWKQKLVANSILFLISRWSKNLSKKNRMTQELEGGRGPWQNWVPFFPPALVAIVWLCLALKSPIIGGKGQFESLE